MEEKHTMHNQHNQHRDPAHAGHGADHDTHTGYDATDGGQMDHTEHKGHGGHGSGYGDHGVDHTGHEQMFRKRFWANLVLTIPVLLFSPMLQEWLGFSMPEFPGSRWVGPAFAIAIFVYGGLPFLQMMVPEVRNRRPGMMTLISLAISVAFVYSVFAVFASPGSGTDVAIESAGIILVRSNPLDVVKIFELSRATYRKIVQNLIWATGYNVVALPLATGVLASVGFVLSPAVGALLMSLSTVIVAINAQLLRRVSL